MSDVVEEGLEKTLETLNIFILPRTVLLCLASNSTLPVTSSTGKVCCLRKDAFAGFHSDFERFAFQHRPHPSAPNKEVLYALGPGK